MGCGRAESEVGSNFVLRRQSVLEIVEILQDELLVQHGVVAEVSVEVSDLRTGTELQQGTGVAIVVSEGFDDGVVETALVLAHHLPAFADLLIPRKLLLKTDLVHKSFPLFFLQLFFLLLPFLLCLARINPNSNLLHVG